MFMKIKFNWGTGIFSFLLVFLLASAAFIIFAFRQDVNLVHKDYYEKGASYSDQMEIKARSEQYKDAFFTIQDGNQHLIVGLNKDIEIEVDSGGVKLYRPSDSDYDQDQDFEEQARISLFLKESLISGRYIATVYWYAQGLQFEISEPVFVTRD